MKEKQEKSKSMLDLKEKKILLELFSSERAPKTNIGKKLGLSNELLSYKIKRLQSEEILKNIMPIIDYAKLGYHVYRLQIRYNIISNEKKKEFIDYVSKIKSLSWLVELSGTWDLVIGFLVKETETFEEIYSQIQTKYGSIIKHKFFSIVTSIEHLSPNYILQGERRDITIGKDNGNIVLEENARKILMELSKNGQLTLCDLGKKLGVSVSTVKYHLGLLESRKIIAGYKPVIDSEKLGFEHFKIMLEFADTSKKNIAKEMLRNNSNIVYITESLGKYDLEFEAEFEKVGEVLKLLEQLKEKIDITNSDIIFTNKELVMNEVL